ncbi:hypothetical protein [Tuwongella immobilis]|uniref:hypothetical protein n=1 Tax=Tuwongella immobilis TaxID=692036 RepID=UPI0013A6AB84|nr:hypothetical protein [Tuwongella immobilis]
MKPEDGNNRVYQERIFTETPDGQRVVIDIDHTNHGRADHVAGHYHVYVENIPGNPKSGWKKLKTPTESGRPGSPPLDADGKFTGDTK